MFGNPEVTPGGRALKFYSSVRLDVRRIESLKQGTEIIGNRTRVKVVKNKVAPHSEMRNLILCTGRASQRGKYLRCCSGTRHCKKEWSMVFIQRTKSRTGQRECQAVLERKSRNIKGYREKIRKNMIWQIRLKMP